MYFVILNFPLFLSYHFASIFLSRDLKNSLSLLSLSSSLFHIKPSQIHLRMSSDIKCN